jgi:glycosyltransferase involved in cell wall biosynthesis
MTRETDRNTTVAQFVENMEIGGLEQMVLALSKRLHTGRFRCVLFCLGKGGPLAEMADAFGIDVTAYDKQEGLDYSLSFRLARLLRRERIDILHCHNYGPLVYGSAAARMARIAGAVYTSHGMITSSEKHQRLLFRLGNMHIVTVSENARRLMLRSSGLSPQRVTVIPNGVDTKAFGKDLDVKKKKASIGLSDSSRSIGIVARLSPEKDHETLFEAFACFSREFHDVHLVVVGGGDLLGDLQNAAGRLGIESRVHFLGYRHDVVELLAIFDCFVLSSRLEGLPMTLLEAMAAGLPVVATDVGGNREVVLHEETGLLVPEGEPGLLADALQRIFADPETARRMGGRGRKRAREHFDLDKMVGRYVRIYDELLHTR